jgi:hypothetical protein
MSTNLVWEVTDLVQDQRRTILSHADTSLCYRLTQICCLSAMLSSRNTRLISVVRSCNHVHWHQRQGCSLFRSPSIFQDPLLLVGHSSVCGAFLLRLRTRSLHTFCACSSKLLSEVLLICNSSVVTWLVFSSYDLTAATDDAVASFLLSSLIIQISDRYIYTHSPVYGPTYRPSLSLIHKSAPKGWTVFWATAADISDEHGL